MTATLVNILAVALGSGIGGAARYVVGLLIPSNASAGSFPRATFAVNVVGCLLIGLICGLVERGCTLSTAMRLFLTVGICGGFTTFSTFVNENYSLLTCACWTSLLYTIASLIVGLAMVYAGHLLASIH